MIESNVIITCEFVIQLMATQKTENDCIAWPYDDLLIWRLNSVCRVKLEKRASMDFGLVFCGQLCVTYCILRTRFSDSHNLECWRNVHSRFEIQILTFDKTLWRFLKLLAPQVYCCNSHHLFGSDKEMEELTDRSIIFIYILCRVHAHRCWISSVCGLCGLCWQWIQFILPVWLRVTMCECFFFVYGYA